MRTTLDLPEDLLLQAMQVSSLTTKTSTVITALEEFIRRHKISELKKYHGSFDLEIDFDKIRGR